VTLIAQLHARLESNTLGRLGVAEGEAATAEREISAAVARLCLDCSSAEVADMIDDLADVLLSVGAADVDGAASACDYPTGRNSAWREPQTAIADAAFDAVADRWPETNVAAVAAIILARAARHIRARDSNGRSRR